MTQKIVLELEQFPKEKHYAIILFETMYIPEQGEDYPSYYESVTRYYSYDNYAEWVLAVRTKELSGDKFVAFQTTPAIITKTVSVDIKI